jgi:uncharacterized membrane protein
MKNKIGISLFVLFFVAFAGSIYFLIYDVKDSNSELAYLFYIVTILLLISTMIYGQNNIKNQLKEGYSASNRKSTISALIVLIVGGWVIDIVTKSIGGQKGFAVGLVLAVILVVSIFIFFSKKKSIK